MTLYYSSISFHCPWFTVNTFWMFVFSLVVNSFFFPFLEEVLKNLVNVFNSKYVSKLVQNSYAWLEEILLFGSL